MDKKALTEKQKMERGMWYDANFDKELLALRVVAKDLCFDFNNTRPSDQAAGAAILAKLIPDLGRDAVILAPFMTDYGCYCRIGEGSFINHNAYLMDGGGITIGDHTVA